MSAPLSSASAALGAQRFAQAAGVLAAEAERLALATLGPGHDADVARRAAAQAHEAADALEVLGRSESATLDAVMQAATWAMTSAAVAIAQANLARGAHRVEKTVA
ncbi:MAG TPA: hypothetical protein VNX21_08740 [Candidatus Thermoplasmatota archaeon]|nr:hypothetical protein [Candidatus Thermoplasmatota archaeon]